MQLKCMRLLIQFSFECIPGVVLKKKNDGKLTILCLLILTKSANGQAYPDTLVLKNDSIISCRLNKTTKEMVYYSVPDKDGNNSYYRIDRMEVISVIDHKTSDEQPLRTNKNEASDKSKSPLVAIMAVAVATTVVIIAVVVKSVKEAASAVGSGVKSSISGISMAG